MSVPTFCGIITALITPFTKDNLIDWQAFETLLQMQEDAGVHGVVISGTTGESPTLSAHEKLSLIRKARAKLPTTIKVIAGTGGSDTNQSVELSKLAADAGADGLLVVTPPYNKPSPTGLHLHFSEIAASTQLPIMLYHVPSRTAQNLSADVIADLCKIENVTSVKEASADLGLFSRLVQKTPVNVLSGDDASFLPSLAVGSKGVVSVISNLLPKAFVTMFEAFKAGQNEKALAIHNAIFSLMEAMFCEPNPAPMKFALSMDRVCLNTLRAPLCPIMAQSEERLSVLLAETKQALKNLGI
jgi:4-hydroxy-tetrahydrodipicolinate synthase